MQKKGKKFLLLLLTLALSAGTMAACDSSIRRDPLEGYESSENAAQSNGGFVVKKDNWYYFINGAEDYTADNTFGKVVKGSLMRIGEEDLAAGNYTKADIVVPQLVVSQDYTSGIFIYGDYVYYATPNTTKNMQGSIENSYLDLTRTKLDGSETKKGYYVQFSNNATPYRYVEENGTVYLLYVDTTNTEIHSLNTQTGTDTVLAAGYTDYAFDTDLTSSTIYYTMAVVKKNTYPSSTSNESYNQLYKVTASATQAPELDLSDGYVDTSKKEGEEGYEMEYVNLGTLVLDGIGSGCTVTPFNRDYEQGETINSAAGFTYDILKMTDGRVILNIQNLDASSTFVYALDDSQVGADWNSIAANPVLSGSAAGALTPVSTSTSKATENSLYYMQDGALYYLYLDSNNAIQRVKVGTGNGFIDEEIAIAKQQSGATLLYLDNGYLYYSMTGTNGNALYRIKYTGTESDYNSFTGAAYDNDDYKPTKYLALDYNSSWYVPETVDGYLFFSNAESYAENYVYIMENPETNVELKELNDRYEDVQDAFTEISEKFSDASNAAKYYFYTGDADTINGADHKEEYQEEDLEVFKAFAECGTGHGFNFEYLKDGDAAYNVQSYYYSLMGKMTDADSESTADSLVADLLLTKEE